MEPTTKKIQNRGGQRQAAIEEFLDEYAPSEDRELLLRAFAAQSAIDWPELAARFGEA